MDNSIQIQSDSMRMINGILEKMKILQGKYDNSLVIIHKQNEELFSLQNNIAQSTGKFINFEEQIKEAEAQIRKEKEKALSLENQLIVLEHKLFLTEQKYQNISVLEQERDELMKENMTLTKTCSELETALEICQLKLKRNAICFNKNQYKSNKTVQEIKNTFEKGDNYPGNFQKNIDELNNDYQEIRQLINANDISKQCTDPIQSAFSKMEEVEGLGLNNNIPNHRLDAENNHLPYSLKYDESQVNTSESIKLKSNNRNSFEEKNEICVRMNEKKSSKNKRKCSKSRRRKLPLLHKNIQKYINITRQVIRKFKKQVSRHKNLRIKWRNTIQEIILNFENRISGLHKMNKNLKAKYDELLHAVQQYEEINTY